MLKALHLPIQFPENRCNYCEPTMGLTAAEPWKDLERMHSNNKPNTLIHIR